MRALATLGLWLLASASQAWLETHEQLYTEIEVCPRSNCIRTLCALGIEPLSSPTMVLINGAVNATNDDLSARGRPTGFSVEVYICTGNLCRRVGQNGGRNISPAQHHEAVQRIAMVEIQPGEDMIALRGKAYNKRAIKGDTLRIDGCILQAAVINQE